MKNPDRLYDLLPAVYRQRDEQEGQPLRALLQVIGEQVEIVESEIDQLYANWFIETCEPWAVPYIGELLGYQLVHEAGEPGDMRTAEGRALDKILVSRRDVAHTIAARRRRGTPALFEELARDVAGWPARVVEFYRLLGVTQAINHLHLHRGRTGDVREESDLDLLDTAFNRIAGRADVRTVVSHHERSGSNVPEAGLFVWRLRAYRVSNTPAVCIEAAGNGENCFTFSVLGNDAPLFHRARPEHEPTHIARELNVPAAIRLRAFQEAVVDERGRVRDMEGSRKYYGEPLEVHRGGKSIAIRAPGWAGADEDGNVPRSAIAPADLRNWDYDPREGRVAVDPTRGRIIFPPEQTPPRGVWVSYYYGFSADIGGGEYVRVVSGQRTPKRYQAAAGELKDRLSQWKAEGETNAVIELTESAIYDDPIAFEIPANHVLQIRAASGTRPVIRLLDHKANEPDALAVLLHAGSRLFLDGLLITGRSLQIRMERSSSDLPRPDYESKKEAACADSEGRKSGARRDIAVVIRHCTLVPGWTLEGNCAPCQPRKASLHLHNLEGRVAIEHSILGPVRVYADEVNAEPLDLRVSDSVIDAMTFHRAALSRPGGGEFAHAVLTIRRSTVLGEIHTHALRLAENCIFAGEMSVARRQSGCVRFCYVVPGSRTPRRYECHPDEAERKAIEHLEKGRRRQKRIASAEEKSRAAARARLRVQPRFNSTRYGDPVYCQLATACPDEIARGADDESEMGVFHDLFQPQRAANLRARLDEFTPAGMETGIIYVT
jgi:hypothetical protein